MWDAYDKEISGEVDAWDTWDKVKAVKGFPGGLVAFMQTSTDHEGCGFNTPSIVQAYAWPILQSGHDLVGVAKTGSGKTLAFLLPGFIKLRKLKKSQEIDTAKGPALLVMTPTRELCFQIFSDAEKFGKPVQITAACAYGGAPKRDQEYALKQGPDCLIATPGRLNDFINQGSVYLGECRFAVLDEADRMLDMGFEPQIRQIMDKCPSHNRQTAMFTATWPKECKKLSDHYIKNPQQIQIGSDEISANKNIQQHIEVCKDDREKNDALKKVLGYLSQAGNCLVFCNTKKKCRDLTWELNEDRRLNLSAVELHGDLDQRARDSALGDFRAGKARVMIATDVAARGLDVRNITIVVNYDAPNNIEDYVHRIGRTGRAEDKGDAYTFLSSWGDEKKAQQIKELMVNAGQDVPQALQSLCDGGSGGGSNGHGDEWKQKESNEAAWGKQGDDEWWKKDEKKEDKKENEWWKKDEGGKQDDWKQDDWKQDNAADESGPPAEKPLGDRPGSLFSLLGKRPASDEHEDDPDGKRHAGEDDVGEIY